jgi:hypothetical protein
VGKSPDAAAALQKLSDAGYLRAEIRRLDLDNDGFLSQAETEQLLRCVFFFLFFLETALDSFVCSLSAATTASRRLPSLSLSLPNSFAHSLAGCPAPSASLSSPLSLASAP